MYKVGDKPIDSLIADNTVGEVFRQKTEIYLNRGKIFVGNEPIDCNRLAIFNFILKKQCLNDTSIIDFMKLYNSFLENHGLIDVEELKLSSLRNTEAILERIKSGDLYWKAGKILRYCHVTRDDYQELIR